MHKPKKKKGGSSIYNSHHIKKDNSKCIINLNVDHKVIIFLEENRGENFCDLRIDTAL